MKGKTRKFAFALVCALLIVSQTLGACTVFAVGKNATLDGSTIISHNCDSNSLACDLRLWIIPSMPAGYERDIVTGSRGPYADYSQFPEVKDYGPGSVVNGTYTLPKDSNRYIHAAVSFLNEKGLALSECTNGYDHDTEQGEKLTELYASDSGIIDYFILTDMVLENCSTAREAVEFMGALIDEYGWTDSAETIPITDGNEVWIFEPYGANVWAAFRLPDDAAFVASNRARINYVDFEDPDNFLCSENIIDYALENDLWDGEGEFRPNEVYAPNSNVYCTRREWRGLTLLDPSLEIDPYDENPTEDWPLYVKPSEKLSVEDIRTFASDYYQGTEFDARNNIEAGPYGNILSPRQPERTINYYKTTYMQISTINASFPDEVKGLSYFGWGAPDSSYITPIFGAQRELPEFFGKGVRTEYDPSAGWWNASIVQQLATTDYRDASARIHEVREPLMETQYVTTTEIQKLATLLVNAGNSDAAKDLLTLYATQQANLWFDTWEDLADEFRLTYMQGTKDRKTMPPTDWWQENVVDKGL